MGAARKYLLYAVGEILLVMVGILLALQANNWNERRKDRITESKVLVELTKNLEMNIDRLEDRLNLIEKHNQSGDIILSAIENATQDYEYLGSHWHRALLNDVNFDLTHAGYEGLKNVGFSIIENDMLKEDIINLYEDTYVALYNRQTWGSEFRPDMDKQIIEYFSWNTKTKERIPRDYQSLIDNNYFIALIEIAALQRGYISQSIDKSLQESQRVLQLIKDELHGADRMKGASGDDDL